MDITEHGVARGIGAEQSIEDFRVFRVAEIGADVGQHEHRRDPVPVALDKTKPALGKAIEFDAGLVRPPLLEQDELQRAAREYVQRICAMNPRSVDSSSPNGLAPTMSCCAE